MKKTIIFLLIGMSIAFSGCNKIQDNTEEPIEDTEIADESKIAENSNTENTSNSSKIKTDNEENAANTIAAEVEEINDTGEIEEIDYSVVKPYEAGKPVVIMYHAILEGQPPSPWQRNKDDFRNDLQRLYDEGYRLISLRDLMDNNIDTALGYTPLAITFDDGLSESFALEEKDGELVLKESCGLDIMTKFAEEYPDFGCTATFYINSYPFPGAGTLSERLNWLVDNGHDIGNHTETHADLAKAGAEEIQREIAYIDKLIKDNVENYEPVGFSYPYGKRPAEELQKYILEGSYDNHSYKYKFAVRAGDSGTGVVSSRKDYEPLNIPRLLGSDGDVGDLHDRLDQYKENPDLKYISDGNPDVISVPEKYKDNINHELLQDKEINIYHIEE